MDNIDINLVEQGQDSIRINNIEHSCKYFDSLEFKSKIEGCKENFSVLSLNIRSLHSNINNLKELILEEASSKNFIFSVGEQWACETELQQYNQKAIGHMRSVWGQLITQIGRDLECENKLRSFLDRSWEKGITTPKPEIHTCPQNSYSTKIYSSRTVNSRSKANQPISNCTSRTKIYARRY
mgnify:CR=1 FL=1